MRVSYRLIFQMSSNNSNKVSLEGKSRLPAQVQDIILNMGSVIENIQSSSGSNETLITIIKNFAIMDPIMENSTQNLTKILKSLDKVAEQNSVIDRSIAEVYYY